MFTDYFVICSANSERQLNALAEAVDETARKKHRLKSPRQEGHPSSGWVLLDFGNMVVHAFAAEQRKRYRLEELWQAGQIIQSFWLKTKPAPSCWLISTITAVPI